MKTSVCTFALLLAACSPVQVTRWEIAFDCIRPVDVATLDVSILSYACVEDPGCTDDPVLYDETIDRGNGAVGEIPRIPPGSYLFSAYGYSDDCLEIAVADEVFDLPTSNDEPIVISLLEGDGVSRCDGDDVVCDGRGHCGFAPPDGGL